MKSHWRFVALMLAVTAPSAWGEESLVGARLRVTRADGQRVSGKLAAIGDQTLTLEREKSGGKLEKVVVSRQDLQRIEISRGPGRKSRGAGIGFLSGVVLGGALGYAAGDSNCTGAAFEICFNRSSTTAAGALVFGAVGAGIGALVAKGERWETVAPSRVQVSVVPVRRGAGIVFAAGF